MPTDDKEPRHSTRVFVYRGNVPIWLGLILAIPAMIFAFSLAAALAIVGLGSALVLPFFLRRGVEPRREHDSIDLDPSQYHEVSEAPRRLPPPPDSD